jgi:hypothetical protein
MPTSPSPANSPASVAGRTAPAEDSAWQKKRTLLPWYLGGGVAVLCLAGLVVIFTMSGKDRSAANRQNSASNNTDIRKPEPVETVWETPPQKARGDTATNTVVLTGTLLDKRQTPVKNETVYLFGWSDEHEGSLINIDKGRVSNPCGVSDVTGRFTIVVKADFLKKHKKFVFGFLSEPSLRTSLLRRGVAVNTFSIDESNYGKTVDLGTVTVE